METRAGVPDRAGARAAIVLLVIAAWFVFHRALGVYFAQEDFHGLAIAAGVEPRHAQLWRYVSVQAFMDVVHPLFGTNPRPYHAVALALHALNAGLLFAWLSSRVRPLAALIGASLFAAHPASFTALYWISARADLLAATFALTVLLTANRTDRLRWLAVPAFLLSLISKESTLLLPGVVLLSASRMPGSTAPHRRIGSAVALHAALATMAAAYLVYLIAAGPGIEVGGAPGEAYAFDFGPSLVRNGLTYVGWTVDLAMRHPGLRFVDAQNPELFPLATGVLAAVLVLAAWPALRRRGWLSALGAYGLLLLPVLPLRNHTYHYYLYAPLLGAAWAAAILAETLTERLATRLHRGRMTQASPSHAGRMAWGAAISIWALLTWNGARLTRLMEERPSPVYPGLRGDPIVDRARIAAAAVRSVRAAAPPEGTELQFIMRERLARIARVVRGSGETMPPPGEVYPETNVRTALQDGVGILVTCPDVHAVTFTLQLGTPAPGRLYAVYAPTGHVTLLDAASLDSLLRSDWVTHW